MAEVFNSDIHLYKKLSDLVYLPKVKRPGLWKNVIPPKKCFDRGLMNGYVGFILQAIYPSPYVTVPYHAISLWTFQKF